MLRSRIVKDALLIPVRYILVCLILVILLTSLAVLVRWAGAYDPNPAALPRISLVPVIVARTLVTVFPVSALISTVVVLFRIRKVKRLRVIALSSLFLVSLASVVFGSIGINAVLASLGGDAPPMSPTMPAGVFYRFDDDFVYADGRTGLSYRSVVRYDAGHSETRPGLALYPDAILDPASAEIIIPGANVSYDMRTSQTSYVAMFRPGPVLRSFTDDVAGVTRTIGTGKRLTSFTFLGTASVFVLFSVSLWFFVRLTRWPLLNAMLAIAAFRLVFFLYALLQSKEFLDLASIIIKTDYLRFLAPAAVFLFGFVFLVLNLLMPPFEEWQREVIRG